MTAALPPVRSALTLAPVLAARRYRTAHLPIHIHHNIQVSFCRGCFLVAIKIQCESLLALPFSALVLGPSRSTLTRSPDPAPPLARTSGRPTRTLYPLRTSHPARSNIRFCSTQANRRSSRCYLSHAACALGPSDLPSRPAASHFVLSRCCGGAVPISQRASPDPRTPGRDAVHLILHMFALRGDSASP